MRRAHVFVTAFAAAALLGGCAGFGKPAYQCPLDEADAGKCASMNDAYTAARNVTAGGRSPLERTSVFDSAPAQPGSGTPQPATAAPKTAGSSPTAVAPVPVPAGVLGAYPEPGNVGMPVFNQPRVFRPWVAPYVDADGNLRSGEYVYFATPGQWNYGTLRRPGEASGIFGPSRQSNLGFKPAPTAAPAAPAPSRAPASPGTTPRPDTTDGITQPYQRLTQ